VVYSGGGVDDGPGQGPARQLKCAAEPAGNATGLLSCIGPQDPQKGVHMRRTEVLAALVVVLLLGSPVPLASAFGTIDSAGQHREHERITRASLACAAGAPVGDDCFAAKSMDFLAGHDREFGGVGAPDSDEISDPRAHCDNADYLNVDYPRTRDQSTAALLECVDHLRSRQAEAVLAAGALLDQQGQLAPAEVTFDAECRQFDGTEKRAKCVTLETFGRVLHGSQDFYAHSNWADEADPGRPIGAGNPPGLNLPGPSSVLDLRSDTAPALPTGLSTGCYVLRDEVPGVGECTGRITHAALNKDNGLVDPASGATADPSTPRGMVKDNFAKAVTGAIEETRRQWRDFGAELTATYGESNAALMTCALSHDDPVADCAGTDWAPVVLGIVLAVAFLLVALAGVALVRSRRRRRTAALE